MYPCEKKKSEGFRKWWDSWPELEVGRDVFAKKTNKAVCVNVVWSVGQKQIQNSGLEWKGNPQNGQGHSNTCIWQGVAS